MDLKLSLGSAIALGLRDADMQAHPTTLYTMVGDACAGNCLFCTQARVSSTDRKFLSRVAWPSFPLAAILPRVESASGFTRLCVQTLSYPGLIDDLLHIVVEVRAISPLPISVCMNPVSMGYLIRLRDAGVDRVGVGLDCATPEIFRLMKPGFHWDAYMRFIEDTTEVFGTGSVHLIVGLGDSDEALISMIQTLHDQGAYVGLFAYTPVRGTQLELAPPPVERYRAIQLSRYLISTGRASYRQMQFQEGRLRSMDVPTDVVRQAIEGGAPFRTSGCPGCNRPMYNERPGGVMYNYPTPLTVEQKQAAETEIGHYLFA